MSRRLQGDGIQPILYLDEPGLYGFTATDPRHALNLQELRILVQALRKEIASVRVVIHVEPDDEAKLPLGTASVPFA